MTKEVSVYLDFLRLMAAFAVFFGHSYEYTGQQFGRLASGSTTDAVAVFFVISGFVIAYVTVKRERTLQQYAIARLGRLYSVAIPAIFLTLMCDKVGLMSGSQWYSGQSWFNPDTSMTDILRYLTFSNEYWDSHIVVGSDEPYWSIGFEASYYALYATVAFSLRNRSVNVAVAVLLLIIVGPKIACYFLLWLIGVATFFLMQKNVVQAGRFSPLIGSLIFAGAIALYVILRIMVHYHPDWKAPNMFDAFAFSRVYMIHVIYYMSVSLLVGLSIVAVSNLTSLLSGVTRVVGQPIRWLAGGTFTLYLVHQPILLMLVSYFPGNPDTIGHAVAIQLSTLVAVFCIAEFTERRKVFWTSVVSAMFGLVRRSIYLVSAHF